MDLRLQCAVRPHSLDPVLLPVGLIIFAQPPYASRLRPDNEPAHARLCTHGMRAAGRCRPAATNAAKRQVDQSAFRRHLPVSHQYADVVLRLIPRANTRSPRKREKWREHQYQSEELP